MNDHRAMIRQALDSVTVIDPHCHVRPAKPAADTIADIVLYHHVWTELVSSGMGRFVATRSGLPHECADPGMPAIERVRAALPYLPNIRNTTLGLFLSWILRDLYGTDALTDANLESVAALIEERGCDLGWQESLFTRCGIERMITVESGGAPCSDRMLPGVEEFPANLVSGKRSAAETLAEMDRAFGRELRTADDLREHVSRRVSSRLSPECRFWGAWVLPSITARGATDTEVTRTLQRVRDGFDPSPDELGQVCWVGFTSLLEALRSTHVRTIQLIAGAEVLLPHRSIPHWHLNFSGALGRLAGAFEDFHFNVSTASDVLTQDLVIIAKHVPNVSVAGYWWHTFYPHTIRKSLEMRLDAVPLNKIVAFFSDAYHAEWCYPKLRLVKEILGDILVDRVDRGWYTTDTAVAIVRQLFYENPKRIYGLS